MGKDKWPSHKATKMLQILKKKLGYRAVPRSGDGSHTWLETDVDGLNPVRWAYHNKVSLSPVNVRDLLVKQVGLSIEQAKEVLGVD